MLFSFLSVIYKFWKEKFQKMSIEKKIRIKETMPILGQVTFFQILQNHSAMNTIS